jgi:hypothetical protein
MDLAEPVARAAAARAGEAPGEPHRLVLDLVPAVAREELRARLIEAAGLPGAPRLARVLAAALPDPPARRLVAAASRQAGIAADDARANELARDARHRLVEALKGLVVPVDGTLGWDRAEVTAGGLALAELDPGTLRVRSLPGLWACGELLDLAGPIGGLNFQAAFATAELAARDAARP